MKTKLLAVSILSLLSFSKMQAQAAATTTTVTAPKQLSSKIRFSDLDHNDTLSIQEVRTVFDTYLKNPNRNEASDLISDVENVIIDLIAYLEKVNCESLKNTKNTKAFIELYFADRFVSAK